MTPLIVRGSWGVLILAMLAASAEAQRFTTNGPYGTPAGKSPSAEMLRDVKFEQRLGQELPLDAVFRDETGREVRLGRYFGDKPVLLALVYYRCPMLCTQVLNGILKSSQAIPLTIGSDYQIVTISFDPSETFELAAEKKAHYVGAYRRDGAGAGWHFLTGDEASIGRIADAVGFRYRFDPLSRQFAHPSGFVVVTPQGRIAKQFYGIDYAPRDLQLALVESSTEKIGSAVDQVLLLCFHYDPLTGRYGLAISAALKAAGLMTAGGLTLFLFRMYRYERRRPKLVQGMQRTAPDTLDSMTGSQPGGFGSSPSLYTAPTADEGCLPP